MYFCRGYVYLFWALWVVLSVGPTDLRGQSTLNFPYLASEADSSTGLAISNPTSEPAPVTITVYGSDGGPLSRIQNPVFLNIPPGQQISWLTSELFGLIDPGTAAWFQATSPVVGLTGFFLNLNSPMTRFDGADLPPADERIIFNQVRLGPEHSTELYLLNPGESPATVQLQLIAPDLAPMTETLFIPPKGVLPIDIADLFLVAEVPLGTYAAATSDVDIAGFEFVHASGGDSLGLNARSGSEQATTLYFPQAAVLGPWKTELGLINYSTQPVIVAISMVKSDGRLYDAADVAVNPATRSLDVGSSLVEDVSELFGFRGEEQREGWIQVESTSPAINGYLSYGVPATGSLASVTGSAGRQTRSVFSHIATVGGLFTGVAVLNPGSLASNVRIVALEPSGEVLGSFDTVLAPGAKISKLIHELVPEAADQAGGLIWVKSDLPVHSTSLFGNNDTLANIPPQDVPQAYLPDQGLDTLKIDPPLAILKPSSSLKFQLDGLGGSVVWKVNGIVGGNETVGTISPQGELSIAKGAPAPQLLTVTAETGRRSVGASVDLLDKKKLLSSPLVVRSVAYLGSMQRLYTAELALLSMQSSALVGSTAHSSAASTSAKETATSEIFEIAPGLEKQAIATFAAEEISKIIGFTASQGDEYLLLAGQTSGRIIRLDPRNGQSQEVVTDLERPSAMVMDPVTDNLLVAERDRITMIPRGVLESDVPVSSISLLRSAESMKTRHYDVAVAETVERQSNAALAFQTGPSAVIASVPGAVTLVERGGSGIAVDDCSGDIYFSDRESGEVLRWIRSEDTLIVLVGELQDPGQLLATYRSGLPCPDGFQLLILEESADQISIITPRRERGDPWFEADDASDILLLPEDSPFGNGDTVLVAEGDVAENRGSLTAIDLPTTYKDTPGNEPEQELEKEDQTHCQGKFVLPDRNLEKAIRAELELDAANPITCELAEQLTTLNAEDSGIKNLKGLEFFPNLEGLFLGDNQIRNLESLSGLEKLSHLDLSNNLIKEIGPLAQLIHLTSLDLSDNHVSDLRPLLLNPGLGEDDFIDVRSTSLKADDDQDVNELSSRGADIDADCQRQSENACQGDDDGDDDPGDDDGDDDDDDDDPGNGQGNRNSNNDDDDPGNNPGDDDDRR